MDKIAIVGSSGAGKTTLAQKLNSALKINAIYLDRLFWQRDWEKISRDERIDILEKLIQEKQWIIEGTYINSSKLHLEAADTIIFLDISPLICLWRITIRHLAYRRSSRRDIPMGSSDRLTVFSILKTLFFPFWGRIKLKMNLHKFSREKVIRFESPKEVEFFLLDPELYVYEYRHPLKKPSNVGKAIIIILDKLLQALNTTFPYFGYSFIGQLDIAEQDLNINHSDITSIYNPHSLK